MRVLLGEEEKEAAEYFEKAVEVALQASCQRAKCDSLIVNNGEIIGQGFNSPPAEMESQRRCNNRKESYDKKVTDKTCCIHAEQRAIVDALSKNPDKLNNSSIYFIRLDKENNIVKAGKPYCTHCSKLALDIGIKEFVLWHEDGICAYNTEEYNSISFQYKE